MRPSVRLHMSCLHGYVFLSVNQSVCWYHAHFVMSFCISIRLSNAITSTCLCPFLGPSIDIILTCLCLSVRPSIRVITVTWLCLFVQLSVPLFVSYLLECPSVRPLILPMVSRLLSYAFLCLSILPIFDIRLTWLCLSVSQNLVQWHVTTLLKMHWIETVFRVLPI